MGEESESNRTDDCPEGCRCKCHERRPPQTDQEKLKSVLQLIRSFRWTLGYFLVLVFSNFGSDPNVNRRDPSHAGFVSSFLGNTPANKSTSISNILTTIYNHPDSAPKPTEPTSTNNPGDPNTPVSARTQILRWAKAAVCTEVLKEATALVSRTSGLRFPTNAQTWETYMTFSLQLLRNVVITLAPTLYFLLVSVATSPNSNATAEPMELNRTIRRRDPKMIAVIAILILIVCRNMQANFFQKVIGVWLFSCSAPAEIYHILSHIGISVSYTTVFNTLCQLSNHSIQATRELAKKFRFLIIFDNINRQRKFWNPSLGQQDLMMSGTASTFVEFADGTPGNEAFDPKPVLEAQAQNLRAGLTLEMLMDRIDQEHLRSVMALHCLNFLAAHCPSLAHLSGFVKHELRTTCAIERMPDNAKTKIHTLDSSNINEGSAAGCREVLNHILLELLKLPPSLVESILVIIGGDLGTIEKLRALKALESSCPHGYPKFAWVLPLVQLWHMGWADLARIINTHWGKPASPDPSTLWHNATLLSSKIKPGARPDYYGSLALALDTLEADVLDCWRLLLGTDSLDLYFTSLEEPMSGPALFDMARKLVSRWATTQAHDAATSSPEFWDGPKSSDNRFGDIEYDSDTPLAHRGPSQRNPPKTTKSRRARKAKRPDLSAPPSRTFAGDHCLANSILRLRDLLWHYEFNWAVADGDIGRVMSIMAVWQFTFTGSGASKYATELLELACGFFFEFPQPLQDAIKKNWLCNLSGMPGCWFPMDLMQEHNIRELKSKSQRRDEDFSGTFFQKVVSRNVRMFTQVRSAVSIGLNLHERSSAHRTKKRQGIANQLRRSLEREETHYYVPGRTFGWIANDDFTDGIEAMPAKLSRFLRKSNTSDESHLDVPNRPPSPDQFNEPEGIDENLFPSPQELPLPTMIVEGQLVPGNTLDEFITDDQLHSEPSDYPPEF